MPRHGHPPASRHFRPPDYPMSGTGPDRDDYSDRVIPSRTRVTGVKTHPPVTETGREGASTGRA
jgi:hypothetical protein